MLEHMAAILGRLPPVGSVSLAGRRAMTTGLQAIAAAAANKKKQWLILIPDHPGVLETRLSVRQ